MTGTWEHGENVENGSCSQGFSSFLKCSEMSRVFYHSLIQALGFLVRLMIYRFYMPRVETTKHIDKKKHDDKTCFFCFIPLYCK